MDAAVDVVDSDEDLKSARQKIHIKSQSKKSKLGMATRNRGQRNFIPHEQVIKARLNASMEKRKNLTLDTE